MSLSESKWIPFLSFAIPLAAYVLSLNGVIASDYTSSILGTQYALWAYHSFSIGGPGGLLVQTVDKGLLNGQWYSAISPGFAIVSFPFAVVGFMLDRNALNVWGYAPVLDELFLAVTAALAAFLTYRISRFYARPIPSLLASLALSLGTVVWPFVTISFIHDASLLFSILAVYLVMKYVKGDLRRSYLAIAGVSLGVATFIEYFAAFFVFPIIFYLLVSKTKRRDPAIFFLLFCVGPLLQLSFNYAVLGNPLLFPEQLKSGSTSLLSQFNPFGVFIHSLAYLISPLRGIVLFSPVVLFGFHGLYEMRKDTSTRLDSTLFVLLFLFVLVPYSAWQDWAGGLAYGPRFMIIALPYLVIPAAFALSKFNSARYGLAFLISFIASSFVVGAGALTSAYSVYGDSLTYQPVAWNIPTLFQGRLDTWWLSLFFGRDPLASVVFAGALFASIWVAVSYLVKRQGRDERILEATSLPTAGSDTNTG